MKKNLLTVIILALLVVNLALTGVMMFFTMSANKKTVALVNQISSILNLEIEPESEEGEAVAALSIEDVDTYNIADEMIIALKHGADEADHYAVVSVSISLDKTSEDYEKYNPLLAEKESKIKSEIINVVSQYTKEEASANPQKVADDILNKLQEMFNSKFVYEVYFRDIKFQ